MCGGDRQTVRTLVTVLGFLTVRFLGFLQDFLQVIPHLNITPFFLYQSLRDLVDVHYFLFFLYLFFSSPKLQRMCSLSIRAKGRRAFAFRNAFDDLDAHFPTFRKKNAFDD